MAEVAPGNVDVEVLLNPLVVHVEFGVRRLHDDEVEVLRVEAVGVVHRAVEQAQRLREDHHGEVAECEHRGRPGVEAGLHRLQPRASVREQLHARLHGHGREALLVDRAAERHVNGGADAGRVRGRGRLRIDDLRQHALLRIRPVAGRR